VKRENKLVVHSTRRSNNHRRHCRMIQRDSLAHSNSWRIAMEREKNFMSIIKRIACRLNAFLPTTPLISKRDWEPFDWGVAAFGFANGKVCVHFCAAVHLRFERARRHKFGDEHEILALGGVHLPKVVEAHYVRVLQTLEHFDLLTKTLTLILVQSFL